MSVRYFCCLFHYCHGIRTQRWHKICTSSWVWLCNIYIFYVAFLVQATRSQEQLYWKGVLQWLYPVWLIYITMNSNFFIIVYINIIYFLHSSDRWAYFSNFTIHSSFFDNSYFQVHPAWIEIRPFLPQYSIRTFLLLVFWRVWFPNQDSSGYDLSRDLIWIYFLLLPYI